MESDLANAECYNAERVSEVIRVGILRVSEDDDATYSIIVVTDFVGFSFLVLSLLFLFLFHFGVFIVFDRFVFFHFSIFLGIASCVLVHQLIVASFQKQRKTRIERRFRERGPIFSFLSSSCQCSLSSNKKKTEANRSIACLLNHHK